MKTSKHYLTNQKEPSVQVGRFATCMARLSNKPHTRLAFYMDTWEKETFQVYMTPEEAEDMAARLLESAARTREALKQA